MAEQTIYLAVTTDIYEQPVAVADTLKELSKDLRLRYDTVAVRMKQEAEPVIRHNGEKIKILKIKI